MAEEKPIFGLLKRIEDDAIATEAMQLVNQLGVNTVEKLAQFSAEMLEQAGVKQETIKALNAVATKEYGLPLSQSLTKPITYITERVADAQQAREVRRFIEYKKIALASDLIAMSKETLVTEGLDAAVIDALEKIIEKEFHIKLGDVPKEENGSTAPKDIVRGYDIIDEGDYLVVNGQIIRRESKKALKKEELIELYRAHAAGKDPQEIARSLKRSQISVENYLHRANVIPRRKSYGRRVYTSASGAPPLSILEQRPRGRILP